MSKRKTVKKSEMVYKDEGEEYAYVLAEKGNCRFECRLVDGTLCMAKAKGSLIKGPKKNKILKEDLVLLQLDMCTTERKFYIIHKYDSDQIRLLKKCKEIPDTFMCEEKESEIIFENEEEDKKEEIIFDDI